MKYLKKIFVLVIMLMVLLSACNSPTFSFTEVKNVPNTIQNNINPDFKLESFNEGEKGSYIVFHSSGDVKAVAESIGHIATIKFTVSNLKDEDVKQHVYYLTTGPEHDSIEVLVNGESTPIDNMTVPY